jgi:DNA polymerase-4
LTDVCGIGRGLEKRLKLLGIGNFQQLRDKPKNFLQKFFGNIGGENLFNMSRGIDESEVVPEDEKGDCKSVSRSYTLAQNTFDKNEILAVLMRLCLDASCALRRDNLAGRTIVFFFRYADFTGAGFRRTFKIGVDDGVQIYEVAEKIVRPWKLHKAVRLVGVHISNLVIDAHQTSLFDDVVKKVKMQKAIDEINDRYGNHTVKPAFLLKLKRLRNKVGGFKI